MGRRCRFVQGDVRFRLHNVELRGGKPAPVRLQKFLVVREQIRAKARLLIEDFLVEVTDLRQYLLGMLDPMLVVDAALHLDPQDDREDEDDAHRQHQGAAQAPLQLRLAVTGIHHRPFFAHEVAARMRMRSFMGTPSELIGKK